MAPDSDKLRPFPKDPRGLALFLSAIAAAMVLVGVASAVTAAATATTPPASRVMLVLAILSMFAAAAGVLWALAWLCRGIHEQALALRRLASAMERPPAARAGGISVVASAAPPASPRPPPAGADESVRLEMVLEQLRELNVNVLLSEPQRRAKHGRVVDRQVSELAAGVGEAIEAGDLVSAERQLQSLAGLAPDDGRIASLGEAIERGRADAESRDIGVATRRVEDLMSTGDFDEAQAAADALLARRPASARAIALMDRVRRERQALLDERRARLYEQVHKEASARHWREALAAAREFLDAFPDCREAESVRVQLGTLAGNARIEEVRELRDRIADLIDRRRFAEALELARDVVDRFPDTAAAAELRGQMTRLAERARGQPDAKI